MIRAILLDLGGPVFNEDAEYAVWTELLVGSLSAQGVPIGRDEFAGLVKEEIARCEPNPWLSATWRLLCPDFARFQVVLSAFRARNEEFQRELPGVFVRPEAKEVIPQLAERYLLALAANQPRKALDLLESAGLLRYFRWREVSETMGLAKPLPLFFRIILDALDVRPQEAVMVGDRLDHDVFPARLLGLHTVRVLLGPYQWQTPLTPYHAAHLCIGDLSQLPRAVRQMGVRPRCFFRPHRRCSRGVS